MTSDPWLDDVADRLDDVADRLGLRLYRSESHICLALDTGPKTPDNPTHPHIKINHVWVTVYGRSGKMVDDSFVGEFTAPGLVELVGDKAMEYLVIGEVIGS